MNYVNTILSSTLNEFNDLIVVYIGTDGKAYHDLYPDGSHHEFIVGAVGFGRVIDLNRK